MTAIQIDQFGPEEKFNSIRSLTQSIETDFIALGELLADVKQKKLYNFRGYERFQDFVSSDYNFSLAIANKLIAIYAMYVQEMDMDEDTLKEIGFDRLCIIKPMLKDADWVAKEEWVKKASEMSASCLKTAVKEAKGEKELDVKDVLIDQANELLSTRFNCTAKELKFKLALMFTAMDEIQIIEMVTLVKKLQRKFEQELASQPTS